VITDDDLEAGKRAISEQLTAAGLEIRDMHEESYSLEDVFIVVVEKARQQGKVAGED